MSDMSGDIGGVHRTFYQLPAGSDLRPATGAACSQTGDAQNLLNYVREQTVGRCRSFLGPFGSNQAVYCDHTASGKSLHFIENYIRDEVLPTYANTHTTATHSALQTTSFRDEARQVVRNAVQASEHDAVIFCGSGATGCVHKLIGLLNVCGRPTVLVGPHEHHSNLLPWREHAAQVIRVDEDPATGTISLSDLEERLSRHSSSTPARPLVACFSAASNVTGVLASDAEVTALVHKYGGLCVWDYATAAPYVRVAMNPVLADVDAGLTQKDALFFSPHKIIGGIQTPGVLVVKKKLVRNPVPDSGGGGTVFFVRRDAHRYLQDVESREEGGTPGIVESIRAGLVLQLKQALGHDNVRRWNDSIVSRFLREARDMPHLVLLGRPAAASRARIPVFSFLVVTPGGSFLHHNFVTALLNDLLGVQGRGGCVCAGPYAQDLLGIDEPLAARYEHVLVEDSRLDRTHLRRQAEYSSYELLRPGFTRLTLSYLLSEPELEHAIAAVRLVCEHGWKLLPQYRVNPETGEWRHHSNLVLRERRWLGDIKYTSGKMEVRRRESHEPPPSLADIRTRALQVIDNARKNCPRQLPDHAAMFDASVADLRWFLLPSEAKLLLHGNSVVMNPPFKPKTYPAGAPTPRPAAHRRRAHSESGPSGHAARPSRHGAVRPAAATTPSPLAAPAVRTIAISRARASAAATMPAPGSAPAGSTRAKPQYLKQRAMSVSCGTDRRLSDTRFLAQELANLFSSGQRTPPPSLLTSADPLMRRVGSLGTTSPLRSPLPPASPSATSPVPRASPTSPTSAVPPAVGAASRTSPVPSAVGASSPTSAVPSAVCAASPTSTVPPAVGAASPTSPVPSAVGVAARRSSPDGAETRVVASPEPAASVAGGKRQTSLSPTLTAADVALPASATEASRNVANGTVTAVCAGSSQAAGAAGPGVSTVKQTTGVCDRRPRSKVASASGAESDDESSSDSTVMTEVNELVEYVVAAAPLVPGQMFRAVSDSQRRKHLSCDIKTSGAKAGGRATTSTPAAIQKSRQNSSGVENSSVHGEAVTGDRSEGRKSGTAAQSRVHEGKVTEHQQKALSSAAKPVAEAGVKWHSPPKSLYKKAAEAIAEFSMLRAGDRVLVCLSGGKDSLSLLHVLHQHQYVARAGGRPFELAAVTVDPQSSAYDPRPLLPYLAKLGVPYFYEVQGILRLAEEVQCSSICSFCSRMKRGRLYAAARRHGYNVLAFGQHLDDISESFLMSVFHNGRLRTMKACYTVQEQDLRVIRPLIYVREKELRQFAESRGLPVIPENCPACFEQPKERHRVKQLLAQQEVLFPHLLESLRAALRPLYAISRTGVESRLFGRHTDGYETDDEDGDDADGDAVSLCCADAAGDRCPEQA